MKGKSIPVSARHGAHKLVPGMFGMNYFSSVYGQLKHSRVIL